MSVRTLTSILALLALGTAASAAAQDAAPAVPQDPVGHVSVQGSGSVFVEPDEARVRLGVQVERPTAAEAQDEMSSLAESITNAIRAHGIGGEQIQTAQLTLYPVYDPRPVEGPPTGEPEVRGYRATSTVVVTLSALDSIGPVIDAAVGAGANRVEGVDFGLRESTGPRAAALARAVESGRQKAEAIASALGVELGPILEVSEQGLIVPRVAMDELATAAFARAGQTPAHPGQIEVTATVALRYTIPR